MAAPVTNGPETEGKYAAMVICWLLGVGCLFPWNSMMSILDYYLMVYPEYHPSRILSLVYMPFALGTLVILAYNEAKLSTRLRILSGFYAQVTNTLLVLVVDLASKGKGGIGPFIAICAISCAFGIADGHVQGGLVGDLSFMHPDLLQCFLAGNAASGAFTTGLRMVAKVAFERSKSGLRKGSVLFFVLSPTYMLLCVFLYAFILPKLAIVKYYRSRAASEGSLTVSADLAAAGVQTHQVEQEEEDPNKMERLSSTELLTQNIDYAIGLSLTYVLTGSIFPGFLSEDTGKHSLGGWYALVLILMFNVWDLIGRYVPLLNCLKIESRKGLLIVILSRFLLIPAFYLAGKYGDQGWMILLTSFLGLTNGHLTVCVLTAAPEGYKGPEQNALGNILVVFQISGIFAGLSLDWLWLIGKGW